MGVQDLTADIINGEVPNPPLFYGLNASMAKLDCVVDMGNQHGSGYYGVNSSGFVYPNKGVINAGFRGLQWRNGNCFANQSVWDGASGCGIRLHQAAQVNANEATANNCCSTTDLNLASVYVSRASTLEFRDGECKNSGAIGLLARRSIVSAIGADASGSKVEAFRAESGSKVDAINSIAGGTSPSFQLYFSSFDSTLSAAGATITNPANSFKVFRISDGGQITVNSATTIDAAEVNRANVFLDTSSPRFEFNVSFGQGIVYKEGEPASYNYQTKGIWTVLYLPSNKFTAWTTTTQTLDVSVAAGAFSGALSLPAADPSFTSIESYSVEADGRTNPSGGGNRVFIHSCVGNSNYSGNEFMVQNTGQQIDGSNPSLPIQSIALKVTLHGTWS